MTSGYVCACREGFSGEWGRFLVPAQALGATWSPEKRRGRIQVVLFGSNTSFFISYFYFLEKFPGG